MPIPAGPDDPSLYVDLDTFRGSLDRPATDTTRDAYLLACLTAASRGIDAHCGRYFWQDTATSTRTFRTAGRVDASDCDGELLLVDDISTATALVVEVGDGTSFTTLAESEYELEPDNALAKSKPATALRRVDNCWSRHRRVRLTATWGWPDVPAQIAQATQIQAARLYKRRSSPEGVLGNSEWGVIRLSRIDPDVQALLAPFELKAIG